MKPARVQAVPHDGARGEGGPHHGGGGQAHREADRGLLRQQVVDAARLGNQDRRQGEETCFTPMGFDIYLKQIGEASRRCCFLTALSATVQSGASGCEIGFSKCFLRVP